MEIKTEEMVYANRLKEWERVRKHDGCAKLDRKWKMICKICGKQTYSQERICVDCRRNFLIRR